MGHWEGKEVPTVCQALHSASQTDLIAKLKSLSHSSGETGSEWWSDFPEESGDGPNSLRCSWEPLGASGSLWEALGIDKVS